MRSTLDAYRCFQRVRIASTTRPSTLCCLNADCVASRDRRLGRLCDEGQAFAPELAALTSVDDVCCLDGFPSWQISKAVLRWSEQPALNAFIIPPLRWERAGEPLLRLFFYAFYKVRNLSASGAAFCTRCDTLSTRFSPWLWASDMANGPALVVIALSAVFAVGSATTLFVQATDAAAVSDAKRANVIVPPVKRVAPQMPENKVKAETATTDTGKASCSKTSKSEAVCASKKSAPSTVKRTATTSSPKKKP